MFARMAGFAAIVMAGLSFSAMAADPPEATVQFDLQWLSPPQVAPAGGQAQAQQTPDYTRLQGVANQGGSFTWPLRYAVETQRYPILTLRYRARDLVVGPTYANRVMDVQLADSAGRMNSLTVVNMEDLVQDGVVHEIRKDLSQVPADAFIDQIRFNFQGGTTGGRLDIYNIVLDRGPNSPEPAKFVQQQVEFVVKDAAGNAVPDAEVRLGLLERSNWVALGSTDGTGRVVLTTLAQTRADGTVDPAEAVVERPGSLPQYVAPIKLPVGEAVAVKLAPPGQQPLAAQVQPVAPPVAEPEVIYSTTVYNSTTYVPYPIYSYSYVQPYPTYWWVPVQYIRPRSADWCDRDDRWHNHYGERVDVRRYDHERPITALPPGRFPPPARVPPLVLMEHGPGPVRPVRTGDWPLADHERDANTEPGRTSHAPGPVMAPPPRLETPPDLRRREDRQHPVLTSDPVHKVVTPPSERQDSPNRDDFRRREANERPITPPQRIEPNPTRDIAPQQPERAPVVIHIPDRADAKDTAKPAPEPVRVPERRDPPARVQKDDQPKTDRPQRSVEPPARTVPVDPAARVQRDSDDSQRRQAQRDESQRTADSQRETQRAADAQRAENQRAEARRDAMQREVAQREESARRDDARRVAQAPPPSVSRTNPKDDTDPNNPTSIDATSRSAAPGRTSRR